MAIIDVVKMDFGQDEFVKKFGVTDKKPEGEMELSTWTQLIVSESQEAVLLRQGALDGPFGPGRHVLKTENIPVIGKVLNLPFGRSPFTAEVWYVNRTMSLDVKWGTPEPIKLSDPKHEILIPVTAYGQFGIQVKDTRKFFIKLVGTLKSFNKEDIRNYFKGMVLTVSKTVLAKQIIERQISVLDIATDLLHLSEKIEEELQGRLDEFGLGLVNFFVNTIDVLDDDPSIQTLKNALAKRAEMKIVGYNYQQERSLNILETAAGNEGTSSGLMGASMGLGMGVGVGNVMGQMMGDAMAHTVATPVAAAPVAAPASAAPAMSMDEKINSIRKFAELKDAGLLTEEEFQTQKTKILNS
jgi:membrane protease subunit (stomatin/prohibitin family)